MQSHLLACIEIGDLKLFPIRGGIITLNVLELRRCVLSKHQFHGYATNASNYQHHLFSCSHHSCILIYPPEIIKDHCTTSGSTSHSEQSSSNAAAIVLPSATVVIVMMAVITVIMLYFLKKKKVKDTDLTK